jgi:hypothetical protein
LVKTWAAEKNESLSVPISNQPVVFEGVKIQCQFIQSDKPCPGKREDAQELPRLRPNYLIKFLWVSPRLAGLMLWLDPSPLLLSLVDLT